MSAVIERALLHAKTYEAVDQHRIEAALQGLKSKRDGLFAVEEQAKKEIERQLATLAREHKRIEHWQTMGLPMIDEVVLTWRHGNKKGIPLPALVMTSLATAETGFHAKGEWISDSFFTETFVTPQMPRLINEAYADVISAVRTLSKNRRASVWLTTTYHGVIPDQARQKILESPFEQDELYLLREVQENDWSLGIKQIPAPPRPRHLDPLVVGVRDATLWLVTSFDPTPLEEYVRDEFALLAGSGLPELGPGK